MTKESEWKWIGIFDLIQLSRTNIATNYPLLVVATCFWSSSLNAFVFRTGMKTITFYDVAALLELRPYGEDVDSCFSINTTPFNLIIIKSTDYSPFIKSYYSRMEEVTQVKHVPFLLTWINKFLSCNHSKKVTKMYLSMTVALASEVEVFLGTFVLSHIYKGMNDLTSFENGKLNGTAQGPIWMVQFSLKAYCSDVFDWKSSICVFSSELYGSLIFKAKSSLKSFR